MLSPAAQLIAGFEGCRLQAYPDPVTGGRPWTVGYGCCGPGIGPGTVWTQQQAEQQLEHRLETLANWLAERITVPLTTSQQAALLSLVWNIGEGNFSSSTLLRELNAGNYAQAADEFLKWDHAGGHVVPGLANRRAAERALFLKE